MSKFLKRLALSITVFFHAKPCYTDDRFTVLTLTEMGNLLRVMLNEGKTKDERKVEIKNILASARARHGGAFIFLDYMPE